MLGIFKFAMAILAVIGIVVSFMCILLPDLFIDIVSRKNYKRLRNIHIAGCLLLVVSSALWMFMLSI